MKHRSICLLLLLVFLLSGCLPTTQRKLSDTHFAMDTYVQIDSYGKDEQQLQTAMNDALKRFQTVAIQTDRFNNGGAGSLWALNNTTDPVKTAPHLTAIFDFLSTHTDPEVDISLGKVSDLWNAGRETLSVPSDEELRLALHCCSSADFQWNSNAQTARRTDIHTELDLGCIAKGYGVDVMTNALKEHQDVEAALINAGGNLRVIGAKADGKPWTIGVQHPRNNDAIIGTIALNPDQAIATSGDYQRYFESNGQRWHHLLSPQSGKPVYYHYSVTVVAPTATEADYYSTLFFLLTDDKILAKLADHPELGVIVANTDKDIWVSDNLKSVWSPIK